MNGGRRLSGARRKAPVTAMEMTRLLHFTACAGRRVAPALQRQVRESLRPYLEYVRSAIAAAKERESRSACRWERVPRQHSLRIEPTDTLVVLDADGHPYRVEGGPQEPPDMPLFVGRVRRPVDPQRVERIGGRLFVVLSDEIDEDDSDEIFWAGQPCRLTPAAWPWPEGLAARRRGGDAARIMRRTDERTRLALVVEGAGPFVLTDGRGAELPHREVDPSGGAAHLEIDGTALVWNGARSLTLDCPPNDPVFHADNGVRWTRASEGKPVRRRQGVWIRLLEPEEVESESVVDIRAAYMDEGVRDVRVWKEGRRERHDLSFQVFGFRRDNYELELDRLPPPDSRLYVQTNVQNLRRQWEAIQRFRDRPLRHHRPLLAVCEHPDKAQWPPVHPSRVDRWCLLANDGLSGTTQQREFVEKALDTPDFAFLEGPPGSGKTHAICELVLQFVDRGQTVLLCSSTHVAVDNVLERLAGKYKQVEAVRIGLAGRVDEAVRGLQIGERVSRLTERWREAGRFRDLGGDELERVAEETVLASANLTCGTTTGILAHPYIRARRDESINSAGPGPRRAYFDVLILDEASKTTFQEFLVPAQLARKWIVVGDVQQLSPFMDTKDLEASVAAAADKDRRTLPDGHREALLILFRLRRREAGNGLVSWAIERPDGVLDALCAELEARKEREENDIPDAVRVTPTHRPSAGSVVSVVSIAELENGKLAALRLPAAEWILFPPELRDRLEPYLPADCLELREWGPDSERTYRFARWHRRHGRLSEPVRERGEWIRTAREVASRQRAFLSEETWAKQVAWRLVRVHQLAGAKNDSQRRYRQQDIDDLMPASRPYSEWLPTAIEAVRDVGVRSAIESLRVGRSDARVHRRSALTEALPPEIWQERATLLEYQHRMHPDISRLPREQFYEGAALKDANTLDRRDECIGWSFAPAAPRRVWVDVHGRDDRGINEAEIEAMERWLRHWRKYAEAHPPRRDDEDWTVACLSFYHRQELGTRNMLRTLTGKPRGETRFALPNTVVSCATVDRFQGREADMVLLSLRNTTRVGHMDSPNRLNVGITRARFLLAVFGHRPYFERCPSKELRALANDTQRFDLGKAQ